MPRAATVRATSSTSRSASPHARSPSSGVPGRRALRACEDARALGAGADERHLDVELAFHELHVAARRGGELLHGGASIERLAPPARRGLVRGASRMEVALVRGKVARAGPSAKLVLGAH